MDDATADRDAHVPDDPASDLMLFETATVVFDAADPANGSLYLCDPGAGRQAAALERAVQALRARGLWSDAPAKAVRDDQRRAYREQLRVAQSARIATGAAELVVLRCDHPKFPSNAGRFAAWVRVLDGSVGTGGPFDSR